MLRTVVRNVSPPTTAFLLPQTPENHMTSLALNAFSQRERGKKRLWSNSCSTIPPSLVVCFYLLDPVPDMYFISFRLPLFLEGGALSPCCWWRSCSSLRCVLACEPESTHRKPETRFERPPHATHVWSTGCPPFGIYYYNSFIPIQLSDGSCCTHTRAQ